MTTDLQHAVNWLREQDPSAALRLCFDAGLPGHQAHPLLEARRPAWLDALAPVVPLDLVQQTALLRAVEATGWRAPLPQLGPLLGLHTRQSIRARDVGDLTRALGSDGAATKIGYSLALKLVEELLDHGYLRLEAFPSNSSFDELNLQLVFRPGMAEGGYQGPPPWPITPVGVRRKV